MKIRISRKHILADDDGCMGCPGALAIIEVFPDFRDSIFVDEPEIRIFIDKFPTPPNLKAWIRQYDLVPGGSKKMPEIEFEFPDSVAESLIAFSTEIDEASKERIATRQNLTPQELEEYLDFIAQDEFDEDDLEYDEEVGEDRYGM